MTEHAPRSLAEALAAAGWAATLDRVRSRAVHDINGRVGSVLAIAELLRAAGEDRATTAQVLDYLDREGEKLERLSARLGALRADPVGPAEPAAADELTASLAGLVGWQRGLEGFEVVGEAAETLPPVLVGRERLAAVLLVLVGRVGLAAGGEHAAGVTLRAEARDDGVAWTLTPAPELRPETVEALASVVAVDGGRLTDGGATVWIPSLARARAEGR